MQESPSTDAPQGENAQSALLSSRGWLKRSLQLYDALDYEDDKLKEHALELVQEIEHELKDVIENMDDEEDAGNEDGWEDEIEADDSDDDHEMADS